MKKAKGITLFYGGAKMQGSNCERTWGRGGDHDSKLRKNFRSFTFNCGGAGLGIAGELIRLPHSYDYII